MRILADGSSFGADWTRTFFRCVLFFVSQTKRLIVRRVDWLLMTEPSLILPILVG